MDSTNMTNASQGKFSVTLRRILSILSLLLIVFVFCPSFLVSCSGEEVKVSAMTAVKGVKENGQTVADPHPVMLVCLLLPIVMLAALFVKKLLENRAAIITFIAAAVDFVVWIIFKNSVRDFADENYCDFETTWVYGANLLILAVIVILTLLVFLMKFSLDQDLIQLFSGGGGQKPSNSVFCKNCGTKNAAGVKFCKECGTPLGGSSQNVGEGDSAAGNADSTGSDSTGSASVNTSNPISMPKVDLSNVQDKLKALPKKVIGIVCAVVVVLAAIIGLVSKSSKTINLNDYLTVEAEGYEGKGKAAASIDWDAIEEKYGTKISYTKSAKKEYGEWLDIMTPIEALQGYVNVVLSQDSNLSNGDTVEYNWAVDEDLSKYFKCKLKYEDGSYQVSELQAVTSFDPFEGVSLRFTGTAPNGNCELANVPNYSGLYYTLENGNNVSNGDTVTVKVSYDWGSEDSYIEEYGRVPTAMSKDYVVEGLDEYAASFEDIEEDFVYYELDELARDTILSYTAKSYSDTSVMGNLEYAGYIFCGTKADGDYWSTYNTLYLIYKANVSNTQDKFEATDVYFPVEFCNILTSCEFEECNGIVGSTIFANSYYNTRGYTDPLKLYLNLAEPNKEEYNVECGDGFEAYAEYSLVSSIGDIDEDYLAELEAEATDVVLSYIEKEYNAQSHVDNLEVKGEYLLVAKNQGADFASNNSLYIVVSGYLYSDKDKFEACDVYYPVEFDGVISLPEQWMYTSTEGIIGKSRLGSSGYTTKGYIDGTEMYSDIVTSHRDNYTYEVSDGLSEFGE